MKTTVKISSLTFFILFLLSLAGKMAGQEASRTISKKFSVNPEATVKIENQFGKIHCSVWDQNEVNIEVLISAVAPQASEAARLVESVKVEIKGSSNLVEAITSAPAISGKGGKTKINVDYNISLPRSVKLVLTNKFGDIYVDENTGSTTINLDYGNLQINRLRGKDHTLNMRFSKAQLGRAENLDLNMNYSEFYSDEIDQLVIESRFSTLDLKKAGSISHDSQYDTNRLGDCISVNANAKFSTISIESLGERLELVTQYGGSTINDISRQFHEILINNSFGNVQLLFAPNTSFLLEAESSLGSVSFPKNSNISIEEKSFTRKIYTGIIGQESRPPGTVNITTKNGDVTLRIK